jgi:hypothetical protein
LTSQAKFKGFQFKRTVIKNQFKPKCISSKREYLRELSGGDGYNFGGDVLQKKDKIGIKAGLNFLLCWINAIRYKNQFLNWDFN